MAPRADTELTVGLSSIAVTQPDDSWTAPAASRPSWKWAPKAMLATIAFVLVAFAALGQQGLAHRSEFSRVLHGPTAAPRRVLTLDNDSCLGWPGTFAVERFDDIGTLSICMGLCSMNGDVCITQEYREETHVCFLKVKCAVQLESTVMELIKD